MAKPNTRTEFIDYVKTSMGDDYIPIEVTDKQVENVIDQALSFFEEHVVDFTSTHVKILETTAGTYEYQLESNIYAVYEVLTSSYFKDFFYKFPSVDKSPEYTSFISSITSGFDNNLFDFELASQTVSMFRKVFSSDIQFEYRKNDNTIYFFEDPGSKKYAFMCDKGYDFTDDTGVNNNLWNNYIFKDYVVAKIYSQMYRNLSRYSNMQAPGGMEINFDFLREQGDEKVKELEEWIMENYYDISAYGIYIG